MKISHHLCAGAAAAIPVYLLSDQSLILSVGFLAANSLIDLDHFFDYWHDHRKLLDIKRFIRACYSSDFRHFIVVLHSYELIVLFWIMYLLGFRSPVFCGTGFGFTLHMLMDQVQMGLNFKIYSLIYRIKSKFLMDKMVDQEVLAQKRSGIKPYEKGAGKTEYI